MSLNRSVNLYQPADKDTDHGAHGSFDDKAGGFMDPSFLKSLPNTAKTLCQAVAHLAQHTKRVRDNRQRLA